MMMAPRVDATSGSGSGSAEVHVELSSAADGRSFRVALVRGVVGIRGALRERHLKDVVLLDASLVVSPYLLQVAVNAGVRRSETHPRARDVHTEILMALSHTRSLEKTLATYALPADGVEFDVLIVAMDAEAEEFDRTVRDGTEGGSGAPWTELDVVSLGTGPVRRVVELFKLQDAVKEEESLTNLVLERLVLTAMATRDC